VRSLAEAAAPVAVPSARETLRVLLVICRPGGRADVPFRDFEAVGPGGAARAERERQLIALLEQEPSNER
jgi:hypothetical protein